MKQVRRHNSIFRRTVTTIAALALLISCVPFVGDTWAWFNDNQNADVGGIQSASLTVNLSITKKDEENTSVNVTQKDGAYIAKLARGSAYTVTLDTDASTVSKAYCEIYSNELNAVTNDIIRNGEGHTDYSFTIDLQKYIDEAPSASEGEEQLPTIPSKSEETANEEDNTSDSGNADENTSGNDDVEGEGSADEGETVIEDPAVPLTDVPETENTDDFVEFTFVPHWGANPLTENTAAVGFAVDVGFGSGPMIIADGDVVNEWGEPIDPSTLILEQPADPDVTEPAGPAYIALSEHNIPLYYQEDYPNIHYASGTVATDGCGITALAMVATYLTEHEYLPDELAFWFGGVSGDNNVQRMLHAADTMGLPYTAVENIDQTISALRDGKIAIIMVGGYDNENPFTDTQHMLVARGITEDGRLLIQDPSKVNYGKWELKEGFEKGFSREFLASCYSGAWIFDPDALPEDYEPYHGAEYVPQPEAPADAPYVAASEHDIPLYFQTDYPNNRYGAGSIATSGCGITSLAMVATYMTGHEYLPDELARWFGGRAENNIQRMLIGAQTMGLPYREAENIDDMTAALYSGKIVIMMQDGLRFENPFTTTQHFMVVRGITVDEKYLIHDPNEQNYSKWNLKEGFEKGFTRSALTQGYSGAWIFDPDAMPEDYEPYHKEEPPRQDNYPGVELTYAEQELLAKLIWAEARGECAEGQQAVAEVVLNRLVSGKFAQSIAGIITRDQFNGVEKMDEAEPWQAQYDAIDAARYGIPVLDKDVFYFGTEARNSNVFKKIGGHIFCYADNGTAEPDAEPEIGVDEDQEQTDVIEPEAEQPEIEIQEQPESEPTPEIQPESESQQPENQSAEVGDPQPEETDEPELGDEDYDGPGLNVRNYYQTEEIEAVEAEPAAPIDSGLVSLAMAATYMTEHEYLPSTLDAWFADEGETSSLRLGIAADTMGLPWVAAEDMEHVANAIANGNLVIMMMDGTEEANLFTDQEHFVVLRGVTEDGKYLMNDPNRENYEREELMDGFENGFDLETIVSVYRNAWIFDPDGLPEDFEPYE